MFIFILFIFPKIFFLLERKRKALRDRIRNLEDDLDEEMELCDRYKEERNRLKVDCDRYLEQRNDLRSELASVEEKFIKLDKEYRAFQKIVTEQQQQQQQQSSKANENSSSINNTTSSNVIVSSTKPVTPNNLDLSANVEQLELHFLYLKERLLSFDVLLKSTIL
jgi:chromosome segregation ATPase